MPIGTEASLQAILAKLVTAAATEARQTTGNTTLAAIQTAVQGATPAGSAVIGGVLIGTGVTPSTFQLSATASTNATLVKSSGGTLFEVSVMNTSAATIYVKIFNAAVAPTPGSGSPWAMIVVPATSATTVSYGANGKRLGTGIAYTITGAMALGDTTAIAAGPVITGTYA